MIGRELSSDIVLTTPTASRRHAELRSDGTG
ncbi:FHA domain-containing protein, partial [Pimelobacter simplex]